MRVIITQQAFDDLEIIYNYFLEVAPYKAAHIIETLLSRLKQLEKFSNSGKEEELLKFLELKHLSLVEGNYKIIYRVSGNIIYIIQFFDARQDPEKMKQKK